jgi:hypothetical protein
MKTLSHFFPKNSFIQVVATPLFWSPSGEILPQKNTLCVCVCVCYLFIYFCDVTKVRIIHKMNESNLAIKSVKGYRSKSSFYIFAYLQELKIEFNFRDF